MVAAYQGAGGVDGRPPPGGRACAGSAVAGGADIDVAAGDVWDSGESKGQHSHASGENPTEIEAGECCKGEESTAVGSPWL